MELHLFEAHNIRSDLTIKDAIETGRMLGAKLDESPIQKLDLQYSKYLEKENKPSPILLSSKSLLQR